MHTGRLIQPDELSGKPYMFISYSKQDMEQVQPILRMLRRNGIRFWYDQGMKSGNQWAQILGRRIKDCAQLLVLLSDNAVHSTFVNKEIGMAIDEGKEVCVLYLSKTNLTDGLQFLLTGIHAIWKDAYADEELLERAVCGLASQTVMICTEDPFDEKKEGRAREQFLQTYELELQIGEGGAGRVYQARHRRTGETVAVKCAVLEDNSRGQIIRETFEQEKRILSDLAMCPFTPELLDWYQDEQSIFLVESRIPGKPLWGKPQCTEKETIDIAKKVLFILDHVHKRNIISRDVKPANLMEDERGDIYLLDFGIAERKLGKTGASRWGTVGFVPPEVFLFPDVADATADIYALGRTMQRLLCPDHAGAWDLMPIRHYREEVSPGLEAVMAQMTAPDPRNRYQTAAEALKALEELDHLTEPQKEELRLQSQLRGERAMEEEKQRQAQKMFLFRGDREEIIRQWGDVTIILEGEEFTAGF